MDIDVMRQFAGPVDPLAEHRSLDRHNLVSAKTKILVRNGQTAVIGGIYQNSETSADNGVPGLMDIPVIGWLFKSRAKIRHEKRIADFPHATNYSAAAARAGQSVERSGVMKD